MKQMNKYEHKKVMIEILEYFDKICRKNNIGFIYTSELGIYGFCFVDFGNNFNVGINFLYDFISLVGIIFNFLSKYLF